MTHMKITKGGDSIWLEDYDKTYDILKIALADGKFYTLAMEKEHRDHFLYQLSYPEEDMVRHVNIDEIAFCGNYSFIRVGSRYIIAGTVFQELNKPQNPRIFGIVIDNPEVVVSP